MKKQNKRFSRKIKDTVFTTLFKIPKYKLELYKALNPKDKDVTEDDIVTITLTAMLSNGIYNDLGLLVKDKILFLMEAQSTWSINILIRMYIYLAETYKKLIDDRKYNLYGSKKINIPIPELYVLYLGDSKIKKSEISLNDEYFGGKSTIDLKLKVITVRNKNDILKEYIEFSRRSDEFRKKNEKPTEKDILSFINKCIKDNILREFLSTHKEEVMSTETMLFDQDYVTEMWKHELVEDARNEGMQQGMKQGIQQGMKQGMKQGKQQGMNAMQAMLDRLVKAGLIDKKEAKKQLELA